MNSGKITYGDFIIQKEHKFLRNVLSNEDLQKSDSIKSLESYHEKFKKYIRICIYTENSIKTLNNFTECFHDELVEFLNENFPDIENFEELKELISEVKVKSRLKISKLNLQIYAFFLYRNNEISTYFF